MLLQILELLLVYVLPVLVQGFLAVFLLHLGVYYGMRRYASYVKRVEFKKLQADYERSQKL